MSILNRFSRKTRAAFSRAVPSGVTTLGSKGQTARVVIENGPDPRGSAYWDGLAARTELELSPLGAPAMVRVGMKGEPMTTYYGDPGPIGGLPAPSHGARNSFASLNANQALPATSPPVSLPSNLKELVAQFQ